MAHKFTVQIWHDEGIYITEVKKYRGINVQKKQRDTCSSYDECLVAIRQALKSLEIL